MPHIISQLVLISIPLLRVSWFSDELGQMPHIDLSDYLLSSCIDHGYILVISVNGRCRITRNTRVGDKHFVIDRIIFYRIGTLERVWLSVSTEQNLSSDFQGMFVEDVDQAIIGISSEDFSKVGSSHDASDLWDVN